MRMEDPGPEIRIPILTATSESFSAAAPDLDKMPKFETDRYRLGHVGSDGVHYYYRVKEPA